MSQQAAPLAVSTALNGNSVNAHHLQSDDIVVERLHLYWRPVFALGFIWPTADRRGVIEVNGLTREMLLDASCEPVGAVVPGSGMAVRIIGKLTESLGSQG